MHRVEVGGRRLVYDLAGAGNPPLVFVHGWCCDRSYFAPQFEHFAARHRVAALDLRGHGASTGSPADNADAYADDVLAVAADAELTRPVLVGHSLGALIALAGAARPAAAGAAVLIDPAPMLDGKGKAFFARSVADVSDESWRGAFAARMFGPRDTVRRDETIAAMAAAPAPVAVAGWQAIVDFDGAAVLPRVDVPVLMITAGEPEPGAAAQLRDVTLGRTAGAGHFAHLEVPDQVNAMIERFLEISR